MGLAAGDLNRRITILRSRREFDGLQHRAGAPEEFVTRWASATPVRDGERFAGGETQASLTMRFVVRYDAQTATIDPTDLVEYDGRTFGIAGVKEVGFREGVEISATARTEQRR
jgi:SPP1 family predicted phage head-tail adaptor